eukprot:1144016-Pelagomonas_calceolata.AAC.7
MADAGGGGSRVSALAGEAGLETGLRGALTDEARAAAAAGVAEGCAVAAAVAAAACLGFQTPLVAGLVLPLAVRSADAGAEGEVETVSYTHLRAHETGAYL